MNEIQLKIADINLDIYMLTKNLENFMLNKNDADENSLNLLACLTERIELFIDSKMKLVEPSKYTKISIDANFFTYQKILSCKLCQTQLGISYHNYLRHVDSANHKQKVRLEMKKKSTSLQKSDNSIKKPATKEDDKQNDFLKRQAIQETSAIAQKLANCSLALEPSTSNNIMLLPDNHNVNILSVTSNQKAFNRCNAPKIETNNTTHNIFPIPNPQTVCGFQTDSIKILQKENSQTTQNLINFLQYEPEQLAINFIECAKQSTKDYGTISANLSKIMKAAEYGSVSIQYFGSRMNGLHFEDSDLDINIMIDKDKSKPNDFLETKYKLIRLEYLLSKDTDNWHKTVFIKGRTPIVKAFYPKLNLYCDITLNNGLAKTNTNLLYYFFEIHPECYKVAAYVKNWADHLGFSNFINNYTLNLLVIFYFQKHKQLPPVYQLQNDNIVNSGSLHEHWMTDFEQKSVELLKMKIPNIPFRNHLQGFYDFYAENTVNFSEHVISILLGQSMNKAAFKKQEFPLLQMQRLTTYLAASNENRKTFENMFSTTVCIQDPFELSFNVGRLIKEETVDRFKTCCKQMSFILQHKRLPIL